MKSFSVRPMTMADLPDILKFTKELRLQVPVYFPPVDDGLVYSVAEKWLKNDGTCAFVACDASETFGLITGYISFKVWSFEKYALSDNFLVRREKRSIAAFDAMLGRFLEWKNEKGASLVNVTMGAGLDDRLMDRLFRRHGFEPAGRKYSRDY